MTFSNWRDTAAIFGILVSVATYATNSYYQRRNMRIENLKRYFAVHDRLLEEDGFLMQNLSALENGSYRHDPGNRSAGAKFIKLLRDLEQVAYLTANNAVPTEAQVYLFGWFAQKVHPHMSEDLRKNIFWEMAVHYIDELKKATDEYSRLDPLDRASYLKKHGIAQHRFKG